GARHARTVGPQNRSSPGTDARCSPRLSEFIGSILGASLLGIECDEVIHSILDVMYAKAPNTVTQRAMRIHPTVTELIQRLSLYNSHFIILTLLMLGELKPLERPSQKFARFALTNQKMSE